MHHEDIKAAIRKRGVTPADIARELGVAPNTVGNVIRGRARSDRIADAVARIVGAPREDIWPDIYAVKKPTVKQLLKRGA